MVRTVRVPPFVVLLVAACHAQTRTPAVEGLDGLTAPLLPSPLMRLGLKGQVDGAPALVEFDVTSPMTFVSTGCTEGSFDGLGAAEFVPLRGAPHQVQLVRSPELRVEGRRVSLAAVALFEDRECSLMLGSDALTGLAFTADPVTRSIHFEKSRSVSEWQAFTYAGMTKQVVALTRAPKFNWPLLAVRLRQGPLTTTSTFALSTVGTFSSVHEAPMRQAGFQLLQPPGPDVKEKAAGAVTIDSLEVTPDEPIDVGALRVSHDTEANDHGITGVLGADVWGQFVIALDLTAGVMLLQRPVFDAREKTCTKATSATQEACFAINTRSEKEGLLTTVAIHRPVVEGLRVWLELDGVDRSLCRVAISVPALSKPFTTQHRLPWSRLAKSLPACEALLKRATGAHFGLIEEGAATECPGVCVTVSDTRSGRISCECQPGPAGFSVEQLSVMQAAAKHRVPPEVLLEEPKDPE